MIAEWDEEKEEYTLVPEVTEEIVEEKVLPQKGLSFVKVGPSWSAVELAFDAETKEAKVVNIVPLHSNVNVAREKFRVKFGKEFL